MLLVANVSLLVALLAADDGPVRTTLDTARQAAEDDTLLRSAGVPTDGPGLVAFLRKQVLTEADKKHVGELMPQLASRIFKVRDRVAADLTTRGPAVLPLLRQAPKGDDLEAQRRLQRCIETLEKIAWDKVGAAAARRLTAVRPEGACAALLAYAPFAGEEGEEELLAALLAVGVRDGKIDPALEGALRDAAPTRRAAAALVLGQLGDEKQREAVRHVLRTDLYLTVRLRAAEGLLASGNPSPVPVLLAILAEGSADLSNRAEDLLRWAAGGKAPPGADAGGGGKKHAAWVTWWEARGRSLAVPASDLAALRVSPARLARKVAERFLHAALFAPDLAEFRKTTDVPFTIYGDKTAKTRAALDEFFEMTIRPRSREIPMGFAVKVADVSRFAEYEKKRKPQTEQDRAFLDTLRGPGVFVVRIELTEGSVGGQLSLPVFVRVRGPSARVFAIAPDR